MGNDLEGFIPYVPGVRGVPRSDGLTGKPGCYIANIKATDELYVGSTADLARRANENLSRLKNNSHRSKNLQAAYNKNPDIEIWVQLTNTTEEAQQLEQKTVDKFLPSGNLLNVGTDDVTRPNVGLIRTEDVKKRMSDSLRGKKRSEESRLKMREACIISHSSEEYKQKTSTVHKERLATEEGKASHARGRDKVKHPITGNGVIYPSITEAARTLGLSNATIRQRCNSDNFPGFFKIDKTT